MASLSKHKELALTVFTGMYLYLLCQESPAFSVKSFFLFVDFTSLSLMALTLWLTILMGLAMYNVNTLPLGLTFAGLAFFSSLSFNTPSLFLFYFMFEAGLLPIFLLILGWGYQMERLAAGLSLLFYTLFASLPLLIAILYLESSVFAPSFLTLTALSFPLLNTMNIMMILLTLAFFVKLPVYFFHLWLAKAHVEAPVSGSMFLAGVLLKLGGYGLFRLTPLLTKSLYLTNLLLLALLGGGFLAFTCIRLMDMKVLIAYSSVVHMAMIVFATIHSTFNSLAGVLFMMLAHGVCSAGLFAQANMFYLNSHSRNLVLNKGQLPLNGGQALWWFLLLMANFGGPFTLNLLSEILLISSLFSASNLFFLFALMLAGFSAAYCLILYSSVQQGVFSNLSYASPLMNLTSHLMMFSLIWPMFLLPLSFLAL